MAIGKAEITVDGDLSPLRRKLQEATRDINKFGNDGAAAFNKMSGPIASLQSKFLAIGAVLGGGEVFRQAVSAAADFSEESIKLGKALGISATTASTFISALEDIDLPMNEFIRYSRGLLREIDGNEAGLNRMGLVTRTAAGELRPLNELMVDAVDVLNQYKDGTDRAVAGAALFGRRFDINGNLTRLNTQTLRENAALQERLGLIVGQENVEAWGEFDQAMDQSNLTLKAIQVSIGNALIPVLTQLGQWFVSIGPAVVTTFRGAIGGLVASFWALRNGVVVLWNTLQAMFATVTEPLIGLASGLASLAQGDFSGAWERLKDIGPNIADSWRQSMADIEASSETTRQRIWELFARPLPASVADQGTRSAAGLVGEDERNRAAEKAAKDAQRAAERALKEEERLRRQAAQQALQIKLLQLDGERAAELARIDELEAQARNEVELGRSTQADLLAQQAAFTEQRLAIEQQYIDRKREIQAQDPDRNPVELERIEQERAEIQRRYAREASDIQRQQAIESQNIWRSLTETISGLWDQGVQALMNGTLTFQNAFRAIGAELVRFFAVDVIGSMVKKWVAGNAAKLAASIGFHSAERALNRAAGIETVALKSAETTAVVANEAAKAGAGAAASQASIPIIGPALALAAMAAVFGAVMALGKRKSALGGYDIPKGVNPVTQLHEEEMVLPQKYADVIRGMAGGQGGGAVSVTMVVNTPDAGSFRLAGDAITADLQRRLSTLRRGV